MAVTQQLARVPNVEPVEVDPTPDWLDRVLLYVACPPTDYLDLDWAGSPLLRVCEHVDPGSAASDAVRRALEGDVRIGVDDYGPVMALSSSAVGAVAHGLQQVDVAALRMALSDDRTDVSGLMSTGFSGSPRKYLLGHLSALRDFYADAARRGLAVVSWWG